MLQPFYNEEAVNVGDDTYRLVINFHAIDATESLLKPLSYTDVLNELTSENPSLALQGKVVWGLLREHHPDVTLDQAASLLFGDVGVGVGLAVSRLLNAAFPTAEKKAKDVNPPKRRGASEPS